MRSPCPISLRMDVELLQLRTTHPFVIARGGQSDHRTVWVRLTDGDGQEGWGEAAPSKFYGETAESVMAALKVYGAMLPDDPFNLEDAEQRWANKLRGNAAARAALSARCTISSASGWGCRCIECGGWIRARPQVDLHHRARRSGADQDQGGRGGAVPHSQGEAGHRPGRRDSPRHPRGHRQGAPGGRELRWTLKRAIKMLPVLDEFGVTVLEQPLAPDDLDGLEAITAQADIPIIADESCLTAAESRPWWAKWMGSTSSSPSAAACGRRCA